MADSTQYYILRHFVRNYKLYLFIINIKHNGCLSFRTEWYVIFVYIRVTAWSQYVTKLHVQLFLLDCVGSLTVAQRKLLSLPREKHCLCRSVQHGSHGSRRACVLPS